MLKPISSKRFDDLLVQLCWSLWSELGVRGVTRSHQDWSIDPEALILLTAGVSDRDPRLRDESLDWCIRFERQLSRTRIRRMVESIHPDWRNLFGGYAGTASKFSRQKWPGASEPFPFKPTERWSLPRLERPALIRLRLRAVFGVSARAEILHALLGDPGVWISASELARLTAYTKRSILDEIDGLDRAGVVESRAHLNRRLHRIRDAKALHAFVGPGPRHFPNWTGVVVIASHLDALFRSNQNSEPIVRDVAANHALGDLRLWTDEVALPTLPEEGPGSYDRLAGWTGLTFERVAAGALPVQVIRRIARGSAGK